MTDTTRPHRTPIAGTLLAAALLFFVTSTSARAQAPDEPGLFLDLHAGVQTSMRAVDTSTSFLLYGETGGIATRQQPGTAGMFDVRVGYRVTRLFGAAFSLSGSESSYTGEVAASIPSPLFVNRPAAVSEKTEQLTRRELGYHLQALVFVPVNEQLQLTLSAGPSIVHVQQPVIDASVPAGTQSVALATRNNTDYVPAVRVGADAVIAITPRFGLGGFVAYTAGKKDFTDVANVQVRSLQAGAGLRIHF
ncbi:MAG: hypothetical protein AB7J63_00670 [Vicinamibacterales bacterium]